ncbi:ANE_G0000030.mRNA.1.CDS.1 [Saccharomyces cerevisiae]|nr:AVI_1a_G0000040.mRNA.1.CDS.1 [Saccharomyces cerevisiae]CAI4235790.1 ANE_G0000030.mRNA.1.CDS.1 [Saccharomyces cerevisiae]CAI6465579.1 ANE_G0000030.mRNA.1.CDS.1 [Saccharomyces cerevisiae]CAI7032994.1 AVI_1a_G0000040.mRNA.1.CDS.1 [Saccharomyces cerevisiae]
MVTTKPLLDNVQQVAFETTPCIYKEITKKTSDTGTNDRKVVSTNLISYLYTNIVWDSRYFINATDCQEASKTILLQPFSLKKDETAKIKSFQDFAPCIKEAFEVSLKKDLLYEENNNFLTSKNFIYENGTQIQFLSIIINEQEKFGSLGMKSEGK